MQPAQRVPFSGIAGEIILCALRARLLQRLQAPVVPLENRIAAIGRGQDRAHQRYVSALPAQPEIGPGAFLVAIDQPGFAEQLQMPGNARLRLAEDLGQIGDGQIAGRKKEKKPQTRGFPRRLQHLHRLIQPQTLIRHDALINT